MVGVLPCREYLYTCQVHTHSSALSLGKAPNWGLPAFKPGEADAGWGTFRWVEMRVGILPDVGCIP